MHMTSADLGPGKVLETLEADTRDGGPISVEIVRISTGRPGPHLAVVAAMHGTEYAPVAALGRLIQTFDPSPLSGTLTLVPVANRLAFDTRTMYVCPPDGKNPNRSFPGNPDGSYAEVLADVLWRGVGSQATHVIDIHGGELVESLVPFTGAYALDGADEIASVSRTMAEAFRPTYLVLNRVPVEVSGGGRLAHTATRAGIPAALVAAGQRGRIDAADVQYLVDGVLNTMRAIGMLQQPVIGLATPPIILDEIEVYASTSGLFYAEVAAGDSIHPGQALGHIVDSLGRTVERFTSEWNGVVLGVIGPAMIKGRFPLVIGIKV